MTTVGIVTGAGRGIGAACAPGWPTWSTSCCWSTGTRSWWSRWRGHFGGAGARAELAPMAVDVTDPNALSRLAGRVAERGTLRAVVHAAGISPTMAEWRQIVTVDLVGTALVGRRPASRWPWPGTAIVCVASMAPALAATDWTRRSTPSSTSPSIRACSSGWPTAVGPAIEDPGMAYVWAKRGVQRLVQREAVRARPGRRPDLLGVPRHHRHADGPQELERAAGQSMLASTSPRSVAPVGPTRSPPSSPSCCPTRPASSPAPTSWSTAGCAPRSAASHP